MAGTGVVSDKVIVELEARLGQYRADVLNARAAFDRSVGGMALAAEQAERRIAASASGIRSALMSTTAVLAGTAGAAGIRRLVDNYTAYTNQLRVAGVEGANLSVVHQQLYEAAQRNGVSLNALGTLYGRASQAAKDLGASQQELLKFTSGIAAAVKVQGGDPSQSSGALLQLSQALGGAIVRAEEFNSVNEGLRPVLVAVANGIEKYGGSVSKLRQDVIDGKVTSQEFFQAFLRGADQLENQANRSILTISQSFQTLQNAASVYIGTSNEAVGATAALGEGMRLLGENLNIIIPALAVIGVAMTGAFAGRQIEGAVTGVRKTIDASNELAQTTRQAAAESARKAQAEAAASAARLADLQAEAARIRANIDLTQQLLREETKRRDQAQANNAAGWYGQRTVGAGKDSAPLDANAALKERERLQQGLIASSQSLKAVEGELNVEMQRAALLTDKATNASKNHEAAIKATSIAARAGQGAVKALGGALAFFGGPIGLAITAVSMALAGVAMEAGGAARAAGDADRSLESLRQRADQTRNATKDLADKQRDQASAAITSAENTHTAANAYDRARQSALDAAEAIKYMTAVQRQALLSDLQDQKARLSNSINGGFWDWVTTDQSERVNNSRGRAARALGVNRGDLPAAADVDSPASRARIEALEKSLDGLTGSNRDAVRAYLNNVAILRDQNSTMGALDATIKTIEEGIRAPTLEEPKLDGSGGGGGGGGDKKDKSPAERSGALRENRMEEERFQALERQSAAAVLLAQSELERAANSADMSAEERRTQIAKAAADLATAQAANDRLAGVLSRIADEERLRLEELASAKNYSAAEKARVAAAIRASAAAQKEAAEAEDRAERAEAQAQAQAAINQAVVSTLQATAENIALTGPERVAAERQLIELQRSEARARLEAVLAQRGVSEAMKERARQALEDSFSASASSQVQNQTADLERERLELAATLARTAQDRAEAEAALLLLSREQRRASVELLIAQLDQTEASQALARRLRENLAAVEASENEQARRARRSPLEAMSEDARRSPQQKREGAETAVAAGLDGLASAMAKASIAGEGFAQTLLDAGEAILEQVLTDSYREIIVAPIADLARQGLDTLFGTAATSVKVSAETQAAVAATALSTATGIATTNLGAAAIAAAVLQQSLLAAAAAAQASAGGDAISSILSSFGGPRAIGGSVSQNLPVVVGENGPEVLFPSGSGVISPYLPQQEAKDRRGGGGINVQIVNNTGVPAVPVVEREDQGNQKITLEPLGNKMIEGAGRSGKLQRALKQSPQPKKRA